MAGLALFANTQSYRADLPKARISTFSIDVNTHNLTGANASLRRGTQMHLGGWRVYADMDRDMAYTAATDTLIVEQGPAGDGVMSNGPTDDNLDNRGTVANGYLLFNPAGFPRSSNDGIATGSVVFYLPEGRATAVVYSQAGRFRRCDPTKAGCRPTS